MAEDEIEKRLVLDEIDERLVLIAKVLSEHPYANQLDHFIRKFGNTMTDVLILPLEKSIDAPWSVFKCAVTQKTIPPENDPFILRLIYPNSPPKNFMFQADITLFLYYYVNLLLNHNVDEAL